MLARQRKLKLTVQNFKRICGLNGLTPTECAFLTGKHRDTVYKALRNPRQFKPTMETLEQLLPNREVKHARTNGH